ncbi:TetR/AcrR family transcriptional regulator [Saliterribacillus persicus]|uniref:TetR family transcriptional regulator n=1 Tax=Saliterribacillus persicus TaxID=930114 RepID=A0A368YB34_9BACI|nr:TetR/AcrR family transcriptional regulator [Saliterribacillus persicus]RCW77412.1 TetR family transcriptional regulator [Saliterribacillus persicus]
MHEKKKRIIEESLKLFSTKGFHATSIQEIAKKSEVSKGAFYLYFESKDELLLAIFDYYTTMVMGKLEYLQELDIEPVERFEKQIEILLQIFRDHKEYLMIHIRDNVQLGDEMNDLIVKLNKQGYEWISMNLTSMYGEKIEPYLVDASIQSDGILQGYFKWMVLHDLDFDAEDLAIFIVKRINGAVMSMINEQSPPIFNPSQLKFPATFCETKENNKATTSELLNKINRKLKEKELNKEEDKQIKDALKVLEEESNKDNPTEIIVNSMLTHLEAVGDIQSETKKLRNNLLNRKQNGEGTK